MEGEVIQGERDEGGGKYEGVLPSGGFYCVYNFQTVASVDDVTMGFLYPWVCHRCDWSTSKSGVRHQISLNLIMIREYHRLFLFVALWEKGGGNDWGWT